MIFVGFDIMKFQFKYLTIATLLFSPSGYSELYFPTELLESASGLADLSAFKADGTQPEGSYLVDIFVNDKYSESRVIFFKKNITGNKKYVHDDSGIIACLNHSILVKAGVNIELYPNLNNHKDSRCLFVQEFITGSFTEFDIKEMRLNVSIPQAGMRVKKTGDINPELWDDGIQAMFTNYRFNVSSRFASQHKDKSYFLNLNNGINIGAWRLRDTRNWSFTDNGYGHTSQSQRINSYAERSIRGLRSQFVIGDSHTASGVFDSLAFRGANLSTNENMYPDSMRNYAPVIRGIAESNAQITVRQSEYVIYRMFVPPGAFEIHDINPVSSSGDLEVTVAEADGSTRLFTIPYASVPLMLRENHLKYSLSGGRLRNNSSRYTAPAFAQGTLMKGGSHNLTSYGGVQYSGNYLAAQAGFGIDMANFGAVSADMTHANSRLMDGSAHKGQSARFLYSYGIKPTGTTFRLTGYRYSTKGFHTLDETALKPMRKISSTGVYTNVSGDLYGNDLFESYNLTNNRRARFEANISQNVANLGSIYLTGSHQTYWNTADKRISLQAVLSSKIGMANYSLNYCQTRQGEFYHNRSLMLSLSLPLEALFGKYSENRVYATINNSRDNHGNMSHQTGLSGTLSPEKNLSWNVSQGTSRNQASMGNAALSYNNSVGSSSIGYSYSDEYQRLSYGTSGAVVLHEDGLTFAQTLGDASVLISTEGVPDIGINNVQGVTTDRRGYAIKPYVSSFRESSIAINSNSLDDHTEIEKNIARVSPTKGAIVRATFAVRQGVRALMVLTRNNIPLPFGTIVTSADSSGIVGDGGQVYLSGLAPAGAISARWGTNKDDTCNADYKLTGVEQNLSVARIKLECQ
jgi:outer membrane usher protein